MFKFSLLVRALFYKDASMIFDDKYVIFGVFFDFIATDNGYLGILQNYFALSESTPSFLGGILKKSVNYIWFNMKDAGIRVSR